jgi:hypothetical protein
MVRERPGDWAAWMAPGSAPPRDPLPDEAPKEPVEPVLPVELHLNPTSPWPAAGPPGARPPASVCWTRPGRCSLSAA